jgi:hypothetical protein
VGDRSRGPLRDARRFPSTRWYPVPGATRTKLGFGICPSFKDHLLSRRAKPERFDSQLLHHGWGVWRVWSHACVITTESFRWEAHAAFLLTHCFRHTLTHPGSLPPAGSTWGSHAEVKRVRSLCWLCVFVVASRISSHVPSETGGRTRSPGLSSQRFDIEVLGVWLSTADADGRVAGHGDRKQPARARRRVGVDLAQLEPSTGQQARQRREHRHRRRELVRSPTLSGVDSRWKQESLTDGCWGCVWLGYTHSSSCCGLLPTRKWRASSGYSPEPKGQRGESSPKLDHAALKTLSKFPGTGLIPLCTNPVLIVKCPSSNRSIEKPFNPLVGLWQGACPTSPPTPPPLAPPPSSRPPSRPCPCDRRSPTTSIPCPCDRRSPTTSIPSRCRPRPRPRRACRESRTPDAWCCFVSTIQPPSDVCEPRALEGG